MSAQHTDSLPFVQPSDDDLWSQEIVPRLPADLEAQAQQHGAFQRVRGLSCATDLLRTLLCYVLDQHSLRSLGAWAVLIGLGCLSDCAWGKRLQRSTPWLRWLFNALLPTPAAGPVDLPQPLARMLLIDATRLGTGDDWRLHTAYDLLTHSLAQATLTDHSQGEHLNHFTLAPGDLVIADGGYGYRRNIAAAQKQEAHVILRTHPNHLPLTDDHGQPIDLVRWLRKRGRRTREVTGWIEHEQQSYPVRVIATRLPPRQAAAARERKAKAARKKQRSLHPDTLLLAEWVVVVTTLPATDWDAEAVLRLYRVRWQVELLYKRMKQILTLNQIRSRTRERAEATIMAMLVAWVLQEQEAQQLRRIMQQIQTAYTADAAAQGSHAECSQWVLSKLSVTTLRQQVRGQWSSQRVRACLPLLTRYLYGRRRKRRRQDHEVQAWLESRLERSSQEYQCAA